MKIKIDAYLSYHINHWNEEEIVNLAWPSQDSCSAVVCEKFLRHYSVTKDSDQKQSTFYYKLNADSAPYI